jgi:hypothetical protein
MHCNGRWLVLWPFFRKLTTDLATEKKLIANSFCGNDVNASGEFIHADQTSERRLSDVPKGQNHPKMTSKTTLKNDRFLACFSDPAAPVDTIEKILARNLICGFGVFFAWLSMPQNGSLIFSVNSAPNTRNSLENRAKTTVQAKFVISPIPRPCLTGLKKFCGQTDFAAFIDFDEIFPCRKTRVHNFASLIFLAHNKMTKTRKNRSKPRRL